MDVKENVSVFNKIPGCDGCYIAGINDWLNCDSNDPGFRILSVEEIIDHIRGTCADQIEEEDSNMGEEY